MTLEVSKNFEEGITVPYAPIFDEIRKNRGFVDVRGRPDLASTIAEGAESVALKSCLIRIASEACYFSLGCDLGSHFEEHQPVAARQVAGGYLQVTGLQYSRVSTDMIDQFGVALEKKMRPLSKNHRWKLDLVGKFVDFCLPNEPTVRAPSMWIWFFAAARSEERAKESREALIGAIEAAIHSPSLRRTVVLRAS